jgi:cephalosporin-C deacetylase
LNLACLLRSIDFAGSQAVNNTPEKLKTIGYYDVVNFARQLTVPGFYSWGYNDNTCPPTSVYASINSIKAPRTISITQITGPGVLKKRTRSRWSG